MPVYDFLNNLANQGLRGHTQPPSLFFSGVNKRFINPALCNNAARLLAFDFDTPPRPLQCRCALTVTGACFRLVIAVTSVT
jgi:hypothetical protein